ncbi:MAG: hypothetical protein N2111_11125 [Candidatus Sumerlaeaceae bacterium]|nr:hypothetical protein [Candidatus Sumerlaeaceae bacterium]
MKQFVSLFAGLALASAVQAAPLFYDNFNLPGGTFENWASHFDQSNAVASSRFNLSGGALQINSTAVDHLQTAVDLSDNVTVVYDVAITTFTASPGRLMVGFCAATAGDSQVDCDLYNDAGVIKIGIFNSAGYLGSDVALSPQPILGTTYRVTISRTGSVVSMNVKTTDGLVTLGSTSRTISTLPAIGQLRIKAQQVQAAIDSFVVTDNYANQAVINDDFSGSTFKTGYWCAEPNPDVNEGGSGGMRIFNFAPTPPQVGGARPDFVTTGYMTIRGGAPAGGGGEFYSRVPTRFAAANPKLDKVYPWFGNVDVMCKIKVDPGQTQFSIALDNRTNEGPRYGAVLDCQNSPPRLFLAECGGAKGFGGPGSISWSPIGTAQNIPVTWDPATEELYIYIRRNGSSFQAWVSELGDGSVMPGFTVVSQSIAAANASGQIVLTAHRGVNQVNDFAVWDFNTGWTLPAPTEVADWTLY